ncbi:MAG: transposase [Desulfobacteraceae bacterium]|nr:MAG: transposase [Desulfobacteraceae bacterium]
MHQFMITFTVPENIRAFIRSHPRRCYSAMFAASSQTLQKLARDEKFIGADLAGFFGVLHTWGRTMPYHPHIHYIVPGGAFSRSDGCWHPLRKDFYLPVGVMSKIFKAKFLDEMKKSGLASSICPDVWKQPWVVNCQAVGTGAQSIKYLAPYVFKVALSNNRIVKIENRQVFFKYKKTGSNRWRTKAFEVMEFMRRFLQHVLPTGFMKVRYYGFMSPGSSISMEQVSACISRHAGTEATPAEITIPVHPSPVCSTCGGNLIYYASIIPIGVKSQESG